MTRRPRQPSPTLSAVAAAIGDAATPLIPSASEFAHSFEAAIDDIRPSPNQPRTRFDEEGLAALAASLREHGQLQPILVRRDPEQPGKWLVVAGERRLRAARSLGWTRIVAIEVAANPEAIALVENLQRADLTPLEEALGIRNLLRQHGISQREAARLLGRHESDISRIQRILTLPRDFLDRLAAREGTIEREILVELARLPEGPLRDRLMAAALEGRLTVRAIRDARQARSAPPPAKPRGNPASAARSARQLAAHLRLIAAHALPLRRREIEALRGLHAEIGRILAAAEGADAPTTAAPPAPAPPGDTPDAMSSPGAES